MNTSWMPWWLYRLRVRWRMWRNSAADLNRRAEVGAALIAGARSGRGVTPEQCAQLARKLGGGL